MMTPEQALQKTIEQFPFEGYITRGWNPHGAHLNIAKTVLRHLEPGAKILDFGCGPCDKTAVLQFLGFECSGYDDLQDTWHKVPENREKILGFIRNCGIDLQLADEDGLRFEKGSFDLIMSHDVMEHLHDSPRTLLNDLLELCRPEGFLFLTMPNAVNIRKRIRVLSGKTNLPRFEDYYWHPDPWRGHVREYVRNDLIKLAAYLDLDIVELRGCDHMLQKLPAGARTIYQVVTGVFDGWKDTWQLVARKRPGWRPKKTLPKDELRKILGEPSFYEHWA